MATRQAASVLPDPVGASRSVDSPRAIGGQPSAWARVGSPSAARNHEATEDVKRSSGEAGTWRDPAYASGERAPGRRARYKLPLR